MSESGSELPQSTSFAVLRMLLRQRRVILTMIAAGAVLGVLLGLFGPRTYTATSRFKPQSTGENASRLAGLAAQFGVSVGGSMGNQESPDFYAELLRSDEILRQAVKTTYRTKGQTATLVELLRVHGKTPLLREQAAIDKLRDAVAASVGPKSGLVFLRVELPSADLATQVNRKLLDLLSAFNQNTRRSQASAERQFVERQYHDAEKALNDAEQDHKNFLEQNRRIGSPELNFENNRLERRISLRQQLYTTLAQAYEQARIDEVRNTPVITIVDPPEGSGRVASGGTASRAVMGVFIGLLIGLMLAVLRENLYAQQRVAPEQFEEVRSLFRDAQREFPLRAFSRKPRD